MRPEDQIPLWAAVVLAAAATVFAAVRVRRDRPSMRWPGHLAALGALAALVVLLIGRARAAEQLPVATVFDSLVLLATTLLVLLFGLSISMRGPALGLFLFPLSLVVLILAALLPSGALSLRPEVPYAATLVHVGLTLAGVAALALAALCSLMYLVQQRRLRRASVGPLSRQIPNLERLERMNRRAVGVGFPLLTIGLALGLVLVWRRGEQLGLSAADPKVISSLLVWALLALLVGLGLKPRFRGGPVALLTILAFVLMVLVIVATRLLWTTAHEFV